jgi:hypothetical protein
MVKGAWVGIWVAKEYVARAHDERAARSEREQVGQDREWVHA